MMLTNVLVVGASGFIGSRLLKAHPDWCGIDLKTGEDFLQFDYRGYEAVIMLAAHHVGFVPEDYGYNLSLYDSLTKLVLTSDPQPFVLYTSSAAVYEPTVWGEHTEDELLRPVTLYGKSKALGEQIVADVCQNYAILRLANVYGDGDGHGAIDLFKLGQATIYGDGEQVRDYIYVDKVVNAISRVVASPGRYAGGTYNISSGVGQTVNEVFEEYGRTKEVVYKPTRPFDVEYSVLSNTLAKKVGLL